MLAQVNTINATQLNSGTAFTFDVNRIILNINNQNYFYNARSLQVKNTSGAKLYFLPVTEKEYDKYLLEPTITDLIPLSNNEEKIISDIPGQITKTIVQGTTGHSSELDFIFLKRGV